MIIDIFSKFLYSFPIRYKGDHRVPQDKNKREQYTIPAEIPQILNKLFLSGDIPQILQADNVQNS